MALLHEPGGELLSYECAVPGRVAAAVRAPKELSLEVIDSLGHRVYSTTLLAARAPVVESVRPQFLEFHMGAALQAQRVELQTPDASFFAAFEARASLSGREFPIAAVGSTAYFEYTPEGYADRTQKLDSRELVLVAPGLGLTPGEPLELARLRMPPVYLLADPELLALRPRVLFMHGATGAELAAEAHYTLRSEALLLVLRRARLGPAGPESSATEIALKPLRIESDTRVVFRVPQGLRSGLYAASLRDTISQRSSGALSLLVLQQELGEGQFASVGPGDKVIGEDFHGPLEATLKSGSLGDSGAVDLPTLGQLAGGLPELAGLAPGCELIIGTATRCPGLRVEQKGEASFTCHIDLRECPDRVSGPGAPAGAYREARLALTLVASGPGNAALASTLALSPPLRFLSKPRLQARLPRRLLLPAGYSGEAVVSFARGAVQGAVPGRTYCIVASPSGLTARAEAAILQGTESQACRFGPGTLDALGPPGAQLPLFLSNNLAAGGLARPVGDPQGLLNLFDTGAALELVDSPFFRSDAVVRVVSPLALIESQKTIVEFAAVSRLSDPAAGTGLHRELELSCRLIEPSYSESTPRFETGDCSFTSGRLNAVRMKVPAGALRAAEYRLQLALSQDMPSATYSTGILRVLPAPRLRSVYPHFLEPQSLAAYGQVYLLGSAFSGLLGVEGTLRCTLVLEQEGRTLGAIAASHGPGAQVLSDHVISCPISRTVAKGLSRHSAVEGLRLRARLSLSPAGWEEPAPPVEIALPWAPEHADAASFELSAPLALLGAAPPWLSAYSQAERQAAPQSLRPVSLEVAPTRIAAAAASAQYRTRLTCEFSVDKAFGDSSSLSTGQVLELRPRAWSAAHGQSADLLACEFPVMETPGDEVYVRLSAEQRPSLADLPLLEHASPGAGFRLYGVPGPGAARVQVLALPVPSAVRPSMVLNLASAASLAVTGEHFDDSAGGLVCLLAASPPSDLLYKSRAQRQSSRELTCPFSPPAALLREHALFLSISNDGGLTRSEDALALTVAPSLPRLLALASPRLLFAGTSATLVLAGRSLGALGSPVQLRMSPDIAVGGGTLPF